MNPEHPKGKPNADDAVGTMARALSLAVAATLAVDAYVHLHDARFYTAVATSTDLRHWEKYPGNPLQPAGENKSCGIVVPDGEGFRLYTRHPEVNRHWQAR